MARLCDVCFIHLGKWGDIIIMLPVFKAVAEQLGKPVIVAVSDYYQNIFDGVSYVEPWVMDLHWWKGVGTATKAARDAGLDPIVVKWWDDPNGVPPMTLESGKNITLTVHGKPFHIAAREWDSFQSSQWRYAGFTIQQMMAWPPVFDRRNAQRERELAMRWIRPNMPNLLVNLSQQGSSPFKESGQVMALLVGMGFNLIDLSRIRSERIYDLLGLYDRAAGLVTSDTATLHLAPASNIPYVAFVNNGGSGSVPKGNCILSIRYGQFDKNMGWFIRAMRSMGARIPSKEKAYA